MSQSLRNTWFGFGVAVGTVTVLTTQLLMGAISAPPKAVTHTCIEWRRMGEPQVLTHGERRCERWSDGKTLADITREQKP